MLWHYFILFFILNAQSILFLKMGRRWCTKGWAGQTEGCRGRWSSSAVVAYLAHTTKGRTPFIASQVACVWRGKLIKHDGGLLSCSCLVIFLCVARIGQRVDFYGLGRQRRVLSRKPGTLPRFAAMSSGSFSEVCFKCNLEVFLFWAQAIIVCEKFKFFKYFIFKYFIFKYF